MFWFVMRRRQLYCHFLGKTSNPDKEDTSGIQSQLAGARLQGGLRHHLPQNGIDTHCNALWGNNGDRAVAAVNLHAITGARIIPALALHLAVGLTPLHLGQSHIF